MNPLDDERALRKGDASGMLEAVAGLARHCREGYALGLEGADLPSASGVENLAFCGMGGSAVAGDVLRVLMADRLGFPIQVIRSSQLPEWCQPHTLVVVSSYSGDTAEALACFEEALRRGCRVVAVTSGGQLGRRVDELALGRVAVPGGFQPRAALGYLALGTLGALETTGLTPSVADDLAECVRELETLADQLAPGVPTSINVAKQVVEAIGERVPVIWGADGVGAVAAARWKTQMNENGKVPAFAAALPELDHNEVVGWAKDRGHGFFLVVLRHEGERGHVAARFELSTAIAEGSGVRTQEVWARGRSPLAQLFSLVIVGDFASTYVGLAHGVDPTPVDAITRLKAELARA